MKNPLKSVGWVLGKIGEVIVWLWEFIRYAPITLLFILAIITITAVSIHTRNPPPDKSYRNFDLVIIDMNRDISIGNYDSPELCNVVLFETTKIFERKFGTGHMYREINTCDYRSKRFKIDTKWYYNHQKGDTVHFDYMLKSEFFGSKLLDKNLKTQ